MGDKRKKSTREIIDDIATHMLFDATIRSMVEGDSDELHAQRCVAWWLLHGHLREPATPDRSLN